MSFGTNRKEEGHSLTPSPPLSTSLVTNVLSMGDRGTRGWVAGMGGAIVGEKATPQGWPMTVADECA